MLERARKLMEKRESMINELLEALKVLGYESTGEITNTQPVVINKGKIVRVVEERTIDNTDHKRIEALEAENHALKEMNHTLEDRLEEMEKAYDQLAKDLQNRCERIEILKDEIDKLNKPEEIVEETKEYENAYCGECMECTDQEILKDTNELKCSQCGEVWERFVDEEDEDPIVEDTEEIIEQEEEVEEIDLRIEYVDHKEFKSGISFLYKFTEGDKTKEMLVLASRNHRLPIVYDLDVNDIELMEMLKEDINNRTGMYNAIENDIVPEYRYHRSADGDLFIYFDEAAELFKGYYCGNGTYGARAFVFDIKENNGPCSRAVKELIKDHKKGSYGKFTTMNGKGKCITMWAERITKECRQLWKQSKNATKIDEAKVLVNKPWKATNEKQYNAAIKFLADMGISVQLDNKSYQESVDAELRHISELRNKGNNRYGRATVEQHMNRAKELGLTNLFAAEDTEDKGNKSTKEPENNTGGNPDEFADIEL